MPTVPLSPLTQPPAHDPGDEPRARRHRLARNLALLSGFRMLQMAMFPVSIVTLYWRDELGFSMADTFAVQAIFGLFAAALELPGGYVADRIGYRVSLLLAVAFSLGGWIGLAQAQGFAQVVAAEALLAASLSLTSGTDAALMYESLLELGRETEFARWYGRSRSLGAAAEGTAALCAGPLFAVAATLPFYAQAAAWAINGALALAMIEPARSHGAPQTTGERIRAIAHLAAVASPRLRASLAPVLALSLSTFIPVWMFAVYAEDSGITPSWIGAVWAAANYAVAIGMWWSDRAGAALGPVGALSACTAAIAVGYVGMGATHASFGFVFYYAICLARGVNGPILSHIQQRLIPSSDRATLLSINSMLFRATFFVLGPAIGAAIDGVGQHGVLLLCAAVLTAISWVTLRWLSRVTLARSDDLPTPRE